MIEKIILNYLNSVLEVPVYMEEPANKPSSFVVVEKTGSGRQNYIFSAMIAIQSYGESLYEAAELNEAVKEAMFGILSVNEVASIRLNSDYNFTDSATKRYRYQAVFELTHY